MSQPRSGSGGPAEPGARRVHPTASAPATSSLSTVLATAASFAALGAMTIAAPLAAQSPLFPADPARVTGTIHVTGIATLRDELTRIAEISGVLPDRSRLIRRGSALPVAEPGEAPAGTPVLVELAGAELRLHPVTLDATLNSAFPDDRNNGLLWAGRGLSTQARLGVSGRWSVLSAGVLPEVAYHQNASFDHLDVAASGRSRFSYPFRNGIDYPQRFGDDAFVEVWPGQSWVRADYAGLAVGLSTENLWWGPAIRYPLLMSNTAPGFLHAFAGTGRPVDVWIGDLEAELVWARMSESDYFDAIPENDNPSMVALVAGFSPRGLPGLSLGAARVYHIHEESGGWFEDFGQLSELFAGSDVNRSGNELFTLFGRWSFPESGAEVYAEWGRDDRWLDLKEVLQEPDHSQAYMVGFQKVTAVGERTAVRVHGEVVAMQEKGELTRTGSRPLPVWYTHTGVRQGHTHRGQLLGAGGIGVGADAQFIGVDALLPWGLVGGYVERVRRNDASAAAVAARRTSPYEHDAELIGGVRGLFVTAGGLSVSGRISLGYRYNRDLRWDDRNVGLGLTVDWTPSVRSPR